MRSRRRSSWPRRPRRSGSTARTCASITSRASSPSPFPLLAAIGARTSRIEIGTAVIDMRYENPLYMAEEAAAADLISGGRLQLGISRGSPEPALRGAGGVRLRPGARAQTDADLAREHARVFRAAIDGAGVAPADPADDRLRRPAADPAAVAGTAASASGGAPERAPPRSGPRRRA